mmetsp:Transcript_34743/g.61065  ORF Transcript_34743/g.61065 Transcript_34743/m.61065 type:complete len:94 (-) Transcript_34743:1088-1369(-)
MTIMRIFAHPPLGNAILERPGPSSESIDTESWAVPSVIPPCELSKQYRIFSSAISTTAWVDEECLFKTSINSLEEEEVEIKARAADSDNESPR